MSAYGVLLRLYPSDQPRDEMLGVLEETGRHWYREAPALILGGLRARSGGGHSLAERWLYAARAAALTLLVAGAAAPVNDLRWGATLLSNLIIGTWVCAGLAALAVVIGHRIPALALAAGALVLSSAEQTSNAAIACFALATVFLLLPGRALPVRNPLPVLLAASWALDYSAGPWVMQSLVLAVLLWTIVDERILLATGLALFAGMIVAVTEVSGIDDTRGLLILTAWRIVLPSVLVGAAALLTRHRAAV